MTYTESIRYLNSFFNFERVSGFSYKREFNLKRMKTLLGWFHHPESNYKTVLVAGTKGKGSTASFLSSLLSAHSIRTGLYTSPHLADFRERIRISGELISKKELTEIISEIKKVLLKKQKEVKKMPPATFFEISTLIALLYFTRKKADWAVLEVGMGGRLDATNAVKQSLSVFTLLGFDHEEHLGKTVRLIAGEKAAILKSKAPFVCAHQTKDAAAVIRATAKKVHAKGFFAGKDFNYKIIKADKDGSVFNFKMGDAKLHNCRIRLSGTFQVGNAALALSALLILKKQYGVPVAEVSTKRGLFNARWPGRFEVVERKGCTIVLDGAHNVDSVKTLAQNMRRFFPNKEIVTVFGVSREKNLKAILPILRKRSKVLITVQGGSERAQIQKEIVQASAPYFREILMTENLTEALQCLANFLDAGKIGLVTGSLYLVGEARRILKS